MRFGISGAGKVGISIAALLEISGFVDSTIIADARMIENPDGLH
jgi:Trk K+ transport system NAD-binding subunit